MNRMLWLAWIVVSGCGDDEVQRVTVQGTVTLNVVGGALGLRIDGPVELGTGESPLTGWCRVHDTYPYVEAHLGPDPLSGAATDFVEFRYRLSTTDPPGDRIAVLERYATWSCERSDPDSGYADVRVEVGTDDEIGYNGRPLRWIRLAGICRPTMLHGSRGSDGTERLEIHLEFHHCIDGD
ncbi:MAG: hypothetical protein NZ898_12750 [Myxococcota bacterium]|nr:hypothetical protein [Myxococcota bacterium]MDW8363877.1 hypothetical protein [Myxococcales bacterium]